MPTWATLALGRLLKAAPACVAGVLAMGAILYAHGESTYARADDMKAWAEAIDNSLTNLAKQVELDGMERGIVDLNAQIRAKEREIADLEMVLAEIGAAPAASITTLRDRLFTLRQDLNGLNQRLVQANSELASARQAFNL